ncbi:MAG: hypothetical protein IK031_03585 [Bacteroidales bacterium]|nr:hypothetical protein [Bacteroidales bacterium]
MKKLLFALAATIILASCTDFGADTLPLHRVTIMYAASFNSLSSEIATDIDEICASGLPSRQSGDVFLVYSHMPWKYGYYSVPTEPVLFRAWADPDGTTHRDTLITYPSSDVSSSPGVMRKVLSDVKELFPAPHYGMVVSSHGLGWIPRDYHENFGFVFDSFSTGAAGTKEFCIENVDGSGININELPDALPMYFDFIIMDACLMGGIETAWEIKDRCRYLMFSPTEILSNGMVYDNMAKSLTNMVNPDVKSIAKEYFDYYQSMPGVYQSATITLLDCTRLQPLADVCRKLVSIYRDAINGTNSGKVQAYFYNNLHWFFDLRDIFVQAGATEEEIAELDDALNYAILYTACTEWFLSELRLERVCGLSMYKPYANLYELNDFYSTLSWNKEIGLLP